MKNSTIFRKITAVLFGTLLIFSVSACDGTSESVESSSSDSAKPSDSSTIAVNTYSVTLHYNDGSGNSSVLSVEEGGTVDKPTDPERTGYIFAYWASDEAGENPFDFSMKITEDAELYAIWVSADVDTVRVIFNYGYDGAENSVILVEKGKRISRGTDPERKGYYFYGWYTDSDGTNAFSFLTRIEENTEIYAKWGQIITFEAEDTDVSQMRGPGWSGGAGGTDMIVYAYPDRYGVQPSASNSFYVSYLYAKYDAAGYNTTLEFKINSSAAVSNAVLYLRLASEAEMTLSSDEFKVEVNGSIYAYNAITFTDTEVFNSDLNSLVCDFEDYFVTATLNLNEGENTIRLLVDNTDGLGGTLEAKGPVVDAIKIASANSVVSWASGFPKTGNYDLDDY